MAINFLDAITVNSGTGSASTIVATGARPVTIKGGGIGSVAIGGSNGGWSTGYFFTGYSGTNRGGFGALGNADTLSYFWIGDDYNDTTMVVQPNAGSVGIGTTAPSDGDLTIGTPKLHVAASGSSGTFNLAARFQSTTTDADNTGTSILINSSNDRGLLIKAGRKDGDREVAYFDVVSSAGNTTNMLTMGKYGSAYNVGIGTTNPAYKLSVENSLQVFSSGDTANPKVEGHLLRVTDTANDNPDVEHRFVENHSLNYGFSWFMDGGNNNFSLRRHENSANGTTVFRVNRSNDTAYFAGNLGIGTTAPVGKLEVAGNFRLTGNGTSNDSYPIHFTNTAVAISRDGNDLDLHGYNAIVFGVSNTSYPTSTERMRITNAGEVGIGTTSPSEKLEVAGKVKITGTADFINTTRNASSQANYIRFYDSSTSSVEAYVGYTSNNRDFKINSANGSGTVTLQAGGNTALRVSDTGNVGIGTTAPVQKLHVSGKSYFYTGGSTPDNTTSTYEKGITLTGGNMRLVIDVSNVTNGGSYMQTRHSSSTYPHVYYPLKLNPLGGDVNLGTDMIVNHSGNVGIGTTSPTQKLDVNGNIVFSQRVIANTNQYYIKYGVWNSASNYGIGMTNGFTYGALNNDYAMTFCMNQDNDRGWWWGYDGQSKSTGAMSCNMQGKLKINHSIGLGTVNPSNTQGRIDASNDIVAYSTSDIRVKDNIKSIDKALDKVNSIQGIEFDWVEKEEVHGNSGHDIGVIAQEIEKILPDVVTTRDNGYKAVKYEKIVPLLIEAIKDLSKQVDGLKRLI